MRRPMLAVCLGALCLGAGCMSSHRKPYASNPLLLYYKPTLSDSASILAERNARREPLKPPMPIIAREQEATPPVLIKKPADSEVKQATAEKPATIVPKEP